MCSNRAQLAVMNENNTLGHSHGIGGRRLKSKSATILFHLRFHMLPRLPHRAVCSPHLSQTLKMTSAIVSLMLRNTFSPDIFPTSVIVWRSSSPNYANTMMTASITFLPICASAFFFILNNTTTKMSHSTNRHLSAVFCLEVLVLTQKFAVLNGQRFMSDRTISLQK